MDSEKLVVFAGAGISMGAPSSLPNWWTLNEWILVALHKRISTEFGISDDYQRILIEYRNCSAAYPPDYQAQFLAECADLDYFEALTALDIDAPNRCHHALAALAKAGRLAAVVTTNFDCLVEQTLCTAGVPFRVACEATSFEQINRVLEGAEPSELSIIKVHGSVKDPSSMVDTRKQRRRGRERSLVSLLSHFLRRYRFLYVGFSAADLEQDRRYLGLWDAAQDSPGFRFLYQPGTKPKDVVLELQRHYGAKAELVEADGAEALEQLAGAATPLLPPAATPTADLVQARLWTWAEALDRWRCLRMTAALQEAASMRVNALSILKTAVRCSPHPSDSAAEHLLATADWVKARLRRARYQDPDLRAAIEWLVDHEHPLGHYYRLLQASAVGHPSAQELCVRFGSDYRSCLDGYSPTAAVDAILLVARSASFFREVRELLPALHFACATAERDGDDVRLAAAQAELAIRTALFGDPDEAETLFHSAMRVASEVRERQVASTALYAYALLEERRGRYEYAAGCGYKAYEQAVEDELRLAMSRALLVQLRVACRHGGPSNVEFVRRQMSHGFEHEFWAHDLESRLYEAEFARRCHEDGAEDRLTEIVKEASLTGRSWLLAEVLEVDRG